MPSRRLVEQGEQRREAIVSFIREYAATNRVAPTVAEITDGVGLTSTATTKNHLDRLLRQGRVRWMPGRSRSISVVDD